MKTKGGTVPSIPPYGYFLSKDFAGVPHSVRPLPHGLADADAMAGVAADAQGVIRIGRTADSLE